MVLSGENESCQNAMPECGVRTLFLRKKKEVKRKIGMLKTFQRRANGVFIVCMPVCGEVIGTKPAWGGRWLNIVQKSALCRMHGNM